MHSIEELVQIVRDRGGKVTAPRIVIWQTLAQTEYHPTAEELYKHLKTLLPSLSMTTLYNALNELVDWGEIRRFDTGDGHIHFDPNVLPHAEVVCLDCHAIIDAPEIVVPKSIPEVIAGYRIVTRTEQYYGYCPICNVQRQSSIAT